MTDEPQQPDAAPPPGGTMEDDAESPHLISVQIDDMFQAQLDADRLHRLAGYILTAEGVEEPVELGVVVTTDAEIHALNRQYLDHDYPTDVISFTAVEEGEAPDATRLLREEGEGEHPATDAPGASFRFVGPPGWPRYLGDIVISYETAAAQAPEYGHPPAAEVDVLLAHGILHLLGYDDQAEEVRTRMHSRQQALVDSFNQETAAPG
jgi:probable rRNA maturation factor